MDREKKEEEERKAGRKGAGGREEGRERKIGKDDNRKGMEPCICLGPR